MRIEENKTKFQLLHKEGIDVLLEERDLRTLLDKHFPDRKLLYDKIDKIVWKEESSLIVYKPVEGTIEAR